MIFEEFEATTTPDDRSNEKIKRTKIREHTTSKPTDSEKATKSSAIDTTLPKKRVAHDNVNNQPKSVPARQPAKNHMQSAMQVGISPQPSALCYRIIYTLSNDLFTVAFHFHF